jgi:hypothetical protein
MEGENRIVTIIFYRTEPLEPVKNLDAYIDPISSTSVRLGWTNPSNPYFRQFHPFVNVHEDMPMTDEGDESFGTLAYIDYSYSHIKITYKDQGETIVKRMRGEAVLPPSWREWSPDEEWPPEELPEQLQLLDHEDYLVTGLSRGTEYTFTVTAVYDCMNTDDNGDWDVHYEPLSDQSAPVQITIKIP